MSPQLQNSQVCPGPVTHAGASSPGHPDSGKLWGLPWLQVLSYLAFPLTIPVSSLPAAGLGQSTLEESAARSVGAALAITPLG